MEGQCGKISRELLYPSARHPRGHEIHFVDEEDNVFVLSAPPKLSLVHTPKTCNDQHRREKEIDGVTNAYRQPAYHAD